MNSFSFFKILIFTYITTYFYVKLLITSYITIIYLIVYLHSNYIKLHFTYMFIVLIREVAKLKKVYYRFSA